MEKDTKKKDGGSKKSNDKLSSIVKKLNANLDECKKQRAEYKEIAQRVQAEFDNYKKRISKNIKTSEKLATRDLLIDFLGILDNIERALESTNNENTSVNDIKNGLDLILKDFQAILKRNEVNEIECHNKEFNPEYHEACFVEENEKYDHEKVIELFQKGYTMHEYVLRPARVKVGKPAQKNKKEEENNG